MKKTNYKGEIITGNMKLIKQEFGTGKRHLNGEPVINWGKLSKYADKNGFDTRKFIEGEKYIIKTTLPKGTIIIRYGSIYGRFTAPDGTDYDNLALPYIKETVEFNKYKVVSDNVKVSCIVHKGYVAPGFDSPGGAIQFFHEKSIQALLLEKVIKRIKVHG